MFAKFDMNLGDVNSLYKFFGCFRDSMEFVSLYIDLRRSFFLFLIVLLSLFFTACIKNLLPILG